MNEIDSSTVKIVWSTRKPLVFAVGFGLLALVLVSSVVIPQFQQGLDLYNDLENEKPKLEKLKQKLSELENIEVSPEFAQVEVVEEALPSKKPLLELLMALSTVSEDTGAVVKEFELSPGLVASDSTKLETKTSTSYDELSLDVTIAGTFALDVTIAGTFAQIQDFLLRVEEVAPFTTIVSMEIGNQLNTNSEQFNQQIEEDPTFEAVLTTETYFFTQSIESRIDSPLPKIAQRELDVLNFLASFRPTGLEEQSEIRGGGLEDLFQINLETGEIETAPAPTPRPTIAPPVAAEEETTL
jgi:hypothetical protein